MRIPYYLLSNPPQATFYSLSFICLEYSHSVLLYSIKFLSPLLQKVFYNLHIPFLVLITFSTFTLIRAGHFNLSIYDWIARTTFLWKLICRWAIFISFQWQFSLVLNPIQVHWKLSAFWQNLLCWKIGFCFIIWPSFDSVNQIKWRTSFIL